jgi:hypothetical protein
MERSENARLPHATAARDVTDMPRLAPAPEVTATKTLARIAGLRYLIVAARWLPRAVRPLQRQGAGGRRRERRQRRGARDAVSHRPCD